MVREYKRTDYAQLMSWCWTRNMPDIPEDILPTYGYLVDNVAVAFLYCTDSSFAMIDCLISNAAVTSSARDEAVDSIVDKLINKAKELGFKRVKCATKNIRVKDRAIRFGFYDCGAHSCLVKEL